MQDATIHVDASASLGPLRRIWRSFGYDELNWTYTPTGKQIFREIAALDDGPYWIRNHNAFTSGNGISRPYWGSTNCYTEDEQGQPHYDWTLLDRVYDVFVQNGCKPMIELDFMPNDLSAHGIEIPAANNWRAAESWRYPPKDYDKWRELNYQFARHIIERYGRAEVRTWYLTVWNECDIANYFKRHPGENLADPEDKRLRDEEFFKVYDYAVEGICAADAGLRIGGPDLAYDMVFLERFLQHCAAGINYATGQPGARLDFISVHAKATGMRGRGVPNPDFDWLARRQMTLYAQVINKFPKFQNLPVLCNKWDIDVGTPYGIHDSPDWQFRNTSYYPTSIIRTIKELLDLSDQPGMRIELVTQWAFYYHGLRCFEGTRALFDPLGIRKPVFNAFEMLARLGPTRIAATTNDKLEDIAPGESVGHLGQRRPASEADLQSLAPAQVVAPHPRTDALAARTDRSIQGWYGIKCATSTRRASDM